MLFNSFWFINFLFVMNFFPSNTRALDFLQLRSLHMTKHKVNSLFSSTLTVACLLWVLSFEFCLLKNLIYCICSFIFKLLSLKSLVHYKCHFEKKFKGCRLCYMNWCVFERILTLGGFEARIWQVNRIIQWLTRFKKRGATTPKE